MQYTLMHKEVPVVDIELDDATGSIYQIKKVYNAEHIPIGIPYKNEVIDRKALNNWWYGRSIPASRQGIQQALAALRVDSTQELLNKSYGLSLSDQYWIKEKGSSLEWAEINFFENDFSRDIGDILFSGHSSSNKINLLSPDNASDGWLRKKWTIINGKRCLIKAGSGTIVQEPYNELIATELMERLNIPHVSYSLIMQDKCPYSICEDFVDADTELISADRIIKSQKKANPFTAYQHYLNCCEMMEIPDVQQAVDRMIVVDYLLANTDRHYNNFGAIRNANTLEWIGPAPIFDSGTSLWCDTPTKLIKPVSSKMAAKPFKETQDEQLRLVSNFSWINFDALQRFGNRVCEVLSGSPYIDSERCVCISDAVEQRIEALKSYVNQKSIKTVREFAQQYRKSEINHDHEKEN